MMTKLALAILGIILFAAFFAFLAFVIFPQVGNSLACEYLYGGEVWKTENPLTGEMNRWCVLPPHGVIDGPAW